jgi:hypothetical protein
MLRLLFSSSRGSRKSSGFFGVLLVWLSPELTTIIRNDKNVPAILAA